jgi:salicylate hydroxylase
VAGAGIGGLTVALALARRGFHVTVLEQAERLEETGAGIQLSPNATRVLIDLGLGERLTPQVVAPEGLRVHDGKNGREIRPRGTAHPTGPSIAAICKPRSLPRSTKISTST